MTVAGGLGPRGLARWRALPGNVQGACWILLAAGLAAVNSAMIKWLGRELPVVQVIFVRALVGAALLLPFALRLGGGALRTRRPFLHTARAICTTGALILLYLAFERIPLATAVALTFTMPLFQILLAVLFLSEVVRWRRWLATLVGFAGVVVMLQPGGGHVEIGALFALASAFVFACSQTMIKHLTVGDRLVTIALLFAVISGGITLVPALLAWVTPTPTQLLLLVLLGLFGTLGQVAWIEGLRVGEVTAVCPFDYTQLLWAGLIGYFVFAELPSPHAAFGAAIIVASTLYMLRREAAAVRPPPVGGMTEK